MEKFNDLKSLQAFVTDMGLILVANKAGALSAEEALALIAQKSVKLLDKAESKPTKESGLDPDVAKVEAAWKDVPPPTSTP